MPDMPTGALVRLYRIQRHMNTISLAIHAGITVRYLEMIEADGKTPSVPVLRRLAKVLGVRTSALLGEAPSENHEGPIPRLAEVERALCTYRSLALADPRALPTLDELGEQITAHRASLVHLTDEVQRYPAAVARADRPQRTGRA